MNNAARENSVSALLVGISQGDRQLVEAIFRESGWKLFDARDRRGARHCLKRNSVHVVIAGTDTPDWDWKQILQDLRELEQSPQLIIASRHADDYLWAEALNLGAYDVLSQPFARDEVERVVASAGRHFEVKPKSVERHLLVAAVSSVA